jgi:hypothetical protein
VHALRIQVSKQDSCTTPQTNCQSFSNALPHSGVYRTPTTPQTNCQEFQCTHSRIQVAKQDSYHPNRPTVRVSVHALPHSGAADPNTLIDQLPEFQCTHSGATGLLPP